MKPFTLQIMAVSSNFSFLASKNERLARLGALAERYFFDDAPSALVKLRQFGEFMIKDIAARHGLLPTSGASFDNTLPALRIQPPLRQSVSRGDLDRQRRQAFRAERLQVFGIQSCCLGQANSIQCHLVVA